MSRVVCPRHLVFVAGVVSSLTLLAACAPARAEGGNWPPVGQLAGGLPRSVAVQGTYAYVAAYGGMTVVDISSPSHPHLVGSIDTPIYAFGVAVSGTHAYVADHIGGLRVIDVSDPTAPIEVGSLEVPGEAVAVAVAGGYAYVSDSRYGLLVIDVSNPAAPVEVGRCTAVTHPNGVAAANGYVYVAVGSGGLAVIDVSNPAAPVKVGSCNTPDYAFNVNVAGWYAYVASGVGGLRVINVSNPAAPAEVGFYDTPGSVCAVAVAGIYAYVTEDFPFLNAPAGLRVINISNPAAPVKVGSCNTPGTAQGVAVAAGFACVADQWAGLRVINVSNPAAPVEAGALDTPANAYDAAVAGGYAYVTDEADGLWVIDVTNPAAPVEVGRCTAVTHPCGVAVGNGYVYVADGDDGLAVIDVSNPAAPVEVGSCNTAYFALNVCVAGWYAYVADRAGGLRVIDVSNPAAPTEIGYSNAAADAVDVVVIGWYAYVADRLGGLRVIDVSNPAAPVEVGYWDTPGNPDGLAVAGGYAYIADEGGGLRVIDISNPTAPAEVGYCNTPALAYDVQVAGGYAYVADYVAGLRVIDVSNPAAPVEVGYWDTPGESRGVTIADGYVYLADYVWGLMIFPQTVTGTATGQVCARGTTTPLAGATVEAYRGGALTKYVQTNANGVYSMALPAGRYTLGARKMGYTTQTKAGIIVPASETAYTNFGLEALAVSGQVTARATGAALPSATVSIYKGGALLCVADTNDSGIYGVNAELPSGVYVLAAAKAGFITQVKANITLTQGQTTYVNFSLDRLCIKGQVRAAVSGANLAGATVRAYQGSVLKSTATAGADGIYELGGALRGTYTVIASAAGYVRQSKANIAVVHGEVTYVNFNLQVSGKLKGQVLDKVSGDPIVGATVAARTGGVVWATAVTSAPYGIYEIASDLPAGTYSMLASKAGYLDQGKAGIAVSAGATTYINFNLQVSGKLKGQVTANGAPVIGATITARSGGVVQGVATTAAPYGIYEIASDLPAGTYSILCQASGYQDFGRIGIVVSAGATTYVNFPLIPLSPG